MKNQILANALFSSLGPISNIQTLDSETQIRTKGLWNKQCILEILSINNAPYQGTTLYSTWGLSEFKLRNENNKQTIRIELLSTLRNDTDFTKLTENESDKEMFYESSLFYLACYLINEPEYIDYGDTWINFFSNEYPAFTDHSALEHLLFMPPEPLLTTNKFKESEIDGEKINMMLCVPISEAELKYRDKNGPVALQELLIKKNIDVSDLFRKSVV